MTIHLPVSTTPTSSPQRLVVLRWALAGTALLAGWLAAPLFQIGVPRLALSLVAAGWLLAAWGLTRLVRQHGGSATEPLLLLLGLDVALLTAMLALSGGPANPLTVLYLPLMVAAAALLPPGRVWQILLLITAGYASLWWLSLPLPVEDTDRAMQMHLLGMWLTFIVSAVLVAGPLARIARALRQREAELFAAQRSLLNAERIGALGAQAAGAAHELGTPLNTIALLADEIRQTGNAAARQDDIDLLLMQVARCKQIIGELLAEARNEPGDVTPVALPRWVEAQARRFRRLHPECTLTVLQDEQLTRQIVTDPTLPQAVLNLLQNAADVSPQAITLRVSNDAEALTLSVRDGGPGFSAEALQRAGRAPFSEKPDGMGMGLLLAAAAAERLGGRLECRNATAPEHGAEASLHLPWAGVTR